MKTFIFGAGASVHAGYPLATKLWPAMEQWAVASFPLDHPFRYAIDELNLRFDFSNFELALAELDARIDSLSKHTSHTSASSQEKSLLAHFHMTMKSMIPIYFDSVRSNPADLYQSFAEDCLKDGDAVITFNYDLALDREMKRSGKWSVGDGYGFFIPNFAQSSCKLFKLHGSTNWVAEPFHGLMTFGQMNSPPMGERPVIRKAEFDYLEYENGRDLQCNEGKLGISSVIMPTANKQFYFKTSMGREWEEFWNDIWGQAGRALRGSDEIYLIGYSIPQYDTRARELIRSKVGHHVPIKVCCHDGTDGVIDSLKRLGQANACPATHRTFGGWIKANANLHG